MKKTIAISVLALVMCGASFAAPKKTTIKCAVMPSNSVNIATATKAGKFADYKGKRYFFCCGGCPEEFKSNPAKYAKTAESIPTPKPAKK